MKRSHIDLRPALRIRPEVDAATLAHALSGHARLASLNGPAPAADGLEPFVSRLLELRCPGFEGSCWGYHFDVETRFFFYGRGTPNTIATAFSGHALLDAHAVTGDPRLLELARGVGRFFIETITLTESDGGAYFGYFPGDQTPIHNASLLAASFLARLVAAVPEAASSPDATLEEAAAAVRAASGFALRHQRDDGSWAYAEGPRGSWVDGFHTGYVLDALTTISEATQDAELASALRRATARGLHLYEADLLLADGTPRFFTDSTYPIDGQSAAQAIRTFALAGLKDGESLEVAWRVYAFACTNLLRPDGAFVFQRGRLLTNRIAHPRWVQAPMLEALSLLLRASTKAATEETVPR